MNRKPSFGAQDFWNWLNSVGNTLSGGQTTGIPGVDKNIQDAIVEPLKTASSVSGVQDWTKGMAPHATGWEQANGILALLGLIGAASSGGIAAEEAASNSGKVKNGLRDLLGSKTTVYHGSPVSGLTKLEPAIAPAAGTAYGVPSPFVYVADSGSANNVWQYLKPSGFKQAATDTRAVTGSIYRGKVPTWRLQDYGSLNSASHWGKRTAQAVKVAEELAFNETPRADALKAFQKFISKAK